MQISIDILLTAPARSNTAEKFSRRSHSITPLWRRSDTNGIDGTVPVTDRPQLDARYFLPAERHREQRRQPGFVNIQDVSAENIRCVFNISTRRRFG